jgi:hypothetical protein
MEDFVKPTSYEFIITSNLLDISKLEIEKESKTEQFEIIPN